jgi:hypothetical protein
MTAARQRHVAVLRSGMTAARKAFRLAAARASRHRKGASSYCHYETTAAPFYALGINGWACGRPYLFCHPDEVDARATGWSRG